MREQCFSSGGSNPAICEVHHVAIVRREIEIDPFTPALGRVSCSVCPVSRTIVREVRRSHAQRSI